MAAASGIRAGKAFVEIGAKLDPLQKGLREAQAQLKAFGAGVRGIGLGASAAATAALAPLAASVVSFASAGDALDEASSRTGASVEALSELGYAAGLSGASMEDLEAGLRILQRTTVKAADGSDAAAAALAKVGVSAADLLQLKPEDQLAAVASGLAAIENPAERAAAAMALLGRGGTKLLPLLEGGSAGLDAFRRRARELGLSITTKDAKAAARLSDALDTIGASAKATTFAVGSALAPTVTQIAESLVAGVAGVTAFVRANSGLIVAAAGAATTLLAVGAGLVGLGLTITVVGVALGGLASALGAVVAVGGAAVAALTALLSPLGLVVGLAAAGGIAFAKLAGDGGASFTQLRDDAVEALAAIGDALSDGDLQSAADVLWAGLKTTWANGTAELSKVWETWTSGLASALTVVELKARGLLDQTVAGSKKALLLFDEIADGNLNAVRALANPELSSIGKVLQTLDGGSAAKAFDDDVASRDAGRQTELAGRLAAIEAAKERALAEIDAARAGPRQELQSALSRAREAKLGRDAAAAGPPVPTDFASDGAAAARIKALEGELDARRSDASLRPEARGTFSTDLASLQAGVVSDRERALRIQEEIRTFVKRIAERVQDGDSLSFAE